MIYLLPSPLTVNSEVVIKGKIDPNAKSFFINFIINSDNYYYQLEAIFQNETTLCHNYKIKGIIKNDFKDFPQPILYPGGTFALKFHFGEDNKLLIGSTDSGTLHSFNSPLTVLEDIANIEITGHESISELTFCYDHDVNSVCKGSN